MNQALYSVVRPTNSDYVSEYGFIPALIAAGAAIAPMFAKKKGASKKDKAAAKKALEVQKAQDAKAKSHTTLYVVGGVVLVGVAITAVVLSMKKKKRK